MLSAHILTTLALAFSSSTLIQASSLSLTDATAIQSTASTLAQTLLGYYYPTDPVGVLPQPYYWWEAGGMWGGLLDYWHYTGDASHNDAVTAALVANLNAGNDFMGPYTDGNDDQGWWALVAMAAAEFGLPVAAGSPSWLSVAQNVFNEMSGRWDMTSCNGGLKWKIGVDAPGYGYKNSVSNGLFFQLAARLYRATGSQEYADMANTIFTWVQSVGLIDKSTWAVYDGTDDTIQCSRVDHDQWSYNVGLYLYGSAVMQAMPNSDPKWATSTTGLLGAASYFFTNSIMQETMCEPTNSCNVDQLSFKAYLARFMAATTVALPELSAQITPLLQSSAAGATSSCGGGPGAVTCGTKWTINAWDGTQGVGQQLSALEVVHGLLATNAPAPQRVLSRDMARRIRFSLWHL